MYKTPKFYGPQLLYQMVKVHFYFFTGKVLLLESHHKIMEVFPWIFRIYRSIFNRFSQLLLNAQTGHFHCVFIYVHVCVYWKFCPTMRPYESSAFCVAIYG